MNVDDQSCDPALEVAQPRVVALTGHQTLSEHIGVEQQAAALRLVVGKTAGKEQFAGGFQTAVVDFLDHGGGLGVPASPFAYCQLDRDPLVVARGAVDLDQVQELLVLLAGRRHGLFVDVADATISPGRQNGIEEVLAVLEVPVETALGDAKVLRQNLDPHALHALFCEHRDGCFDPLVAVECCPWPGTSVLHRHVVLS
jgi:hypothetical protein